MSDQEGRTWWEEPSGMAVILSGGAPSAHLVSGAMCAFYESKVSFDIVGASGAGALPGLLYASPAGVFEDPKGNPIPAPVGALRSTPHWNVSDFLYDLMPINYKLFQKKGPFSTMFWEMAQRVPSFKLDTTPDYHPSGRRLWNDFVRFVFAAATPTTLNYYSKSVCTRVPPMLNAFVDWEQLQNGYPKRFFVNAFNIGTQELELFSEDMMTTEVLYAALAMPWLYNPQKATRPNGVTGMYTEGASHDPSGLRAILGEILNPDSAFDIDCIVALETVTPDLWNDPSGAYDALQLSIMDPITALSERTLALYALIETTAQQLGINTLPKLYRVPFDFPPWEERRILEWSYSNGLTLWHIGYEAGLDFIDQMVQKGRLPDPSTLLEAHGLTDHHLPGVPAPDFDGRRVRRSRHAPASPPSDLEEYRYFEYVKTQPRLMDFLKLFQPMLDALGRLGGGGGGGGGVPAGRGGRGGDVEPVPVRDERRDDPTDPAGPAGPIPGGRPDDADAPADGGEDEA